MLPPDGHTEGYAEINGLRMYYQCHGPVVGGSSGSDDPPLILLPGGVLTIELSFGELIPALAARHRLIAVELQGHGRTADIDREPTVAAWAGDVLALLDHLEVPRADVLGFSLGGLVALQLAISHPDRVRRLVLAAAQYHQGGYYPEIMSGDSPRLPGEADFARMREAYRAVAPDPDTFDSFVARTGTVIERWVGWTDDDLRAVTSATLLVIGDTDFVRPEHAEQMHRLIPDSDLAVLPRTTHMALVRRAELLGPMISAFLTEPR